MGELTGPNSWDSKIYSQPYLVHTIGNLTLLPHPENDSIGNRSWDKKRLLFEAFASENQEEIDHLIRKAKSEGLSLSKRTTAILREGRHHPLARAIKDVPDWNVTVIEQRTDNIADLVWQELAPLLDFPE